MELLYASKICTSVPSRDVGTLEGSRTVLVRISRVTMGEESQTRTHPLGHLSSLAATGFEDSGTTDGTTVNFNLSISIS